MSGTSLRVSLLKRWITKGSVVGLEHHLMFKVSQWGFEGPFPLMSFDLEKVISTETEFGKMVV